ncbi:hypothetical protein Cni_G14896 [Canna indica]|uniref:CCT domain-containing protein n=1 Tax=Canna indica TaxID=4628 RepID=A0AAQ3QCT2_9LILI|nr:hypothetical protein Cni_G14896 [Canna indica]
MAEGISSPIAAQLLDFCDDEGAGADAGELFAPSEDQQDQPLLFHPYDDVSSAAAAVTTLAATNCYPIDDDATFSPFPAFYSLLEASPPPADSEPDLSRYPSSSSSSNPIPPPPSSMFPVPPPMFVGDPFDHSGFSLVPAPLVAPIPASGPASSHPLAAYEEESYATAAGPRPPPNELLGLEAPPFGFLDGIGMGPLYCGGMLCNGEPAQGLFGGGIPSLGPDAGLLPPPGDAAESGGLPPLGHDAIPRAYSSGDMKVIGGGGQHLMGGCNGNPSPLPSSDIAAASDESSGKVGRLSAEERKEKIKRYMKKRNNRNFSKKIKYACRKTLADSRPRVRGRFAKNDELGEVTRLSSSSHEFDDEEEEVVIKGEDTIDSSDVLAHISGVNSFKYIFTLESWI